MAMIDTEQDSNMNSPSEGDLRVWWIPQVPGQAFEVALQEAGHIGSPSEPPDNDAHWQD